MKTLLLSALVWLPAYVAAFGQTTTSQVRPVAAFHAINVGSGIELDLTAGHSQRVEVSAASNEYRDRIQTSVEGGVLTLRYRNPDGNWNNHTNKHLHVAVTADQLTALSAGGGSQANANGNFAAASDFQLDVSAGATLKADMTTADLQVRQGSGSSVALSGRAQRLDVRAGSGATFNGRDLQTDRCQAQASSGGSVRVAVREELTADAASGASITYSGSPTVTKHTSSGGSVSAR